MNLALTDGEITLRLFTLADAEEHLAGEDEEQIKWLSGGKGSLEGVREWIKKNQEYWEHDGPIFNFAIIDTADKLVGMVEANTDSKTVEGLDEGDANISYGLYPFARGRGYATRAVQLITGFLRQKGVKRAVIRVNPKNSDSLAVPIRCGFEEKRILFTKDGGELKIFVKRLL